MNWPPGYNRKQVKESSRDFSLNRCRLYLRLRSWRWTRTAPRWAWMIAGHVLTLLPPLLRQLYGHPPPPQKVVVTVACGPAIRVRPGFSGTIKKGGRQNAFVAAKGDLTGVGPPGRARVLHKVEGPANNKNRLPTFAMQNTNLPIRNTWRCNQNGISGRYKSG